MQAPQDTMRTDGVVWALHFAGDDDKQAWSWQHFDLVTPHARAAIEEVPHIPRAACRILTDHDETPRVVVVDSDTVAGVLPTYARSGGLDRLELSHWHFVLRPDRLMTGRRRPSRSLLTVYEAIKDGMTPGSPAAVLDQSLADFVRTARARLAALADDLDALEEALVDQRGATGGLTDLGGRLGPIRREAVALRRALAPVIRVIDDAAAELPGWMLTPELESARAAGVGALDDVAALQDRARTLQDELTTRLSEETNRRLYIVSVVTTLALPATFITGFFGMNTGGMLWAGDSAGHGTLYAGLVCLAAVLLTLGLLRWKRLL